MHNTFFQKLGERLYKENNLSDVTWALCETSPNFKELFLWFFFNSDISNYEKAVIHREYSIEGKRPDFWIEADGKTFVIEVKIYDGNHHFDDFDKKLNIHKPIGYIANYYISQREGYVIKTWTEFKNHVELHLSEKDNPNEDFLLIEQYLHYLKQVCYMVDYKKMDLRGLKSLYHFNVMIEEIIKSYPTDNAGIAIYNSTKNYDCESSGTSFYYTPLELKKEIYPWIGIFYACEEPTICFSLSDEEYKSVYSVLLNMGGIIKEGEFFNTPYQDEYDTFWYFELNQTKTDKFHESEVKEQRQILEAFFKEVMESIEKYI